MTSEEAIEILEERWRYSKTYKYTDAEIREAFDMAINALEQEPCEDVISRQAVLETQTKYAEYVGATKFWQMRDDIKALPSVTPQYTEAEIQKIQELEQAQLEKAYEIGKARSEKFQQKAEVVISQLRADRDRLEDVIEKMKAEIKQVKSIMNEEIINHDRKDLINFVNGLNQSLAIIDTHTKESEATE